VQQQVPADPWQPIRDLVDAFGVSMYNAMRSGKGFCVDECRSEFTGDDVEYDEELKGLPHKTKITRKAKSVGI